LNKTKLTLFISSNMNGKGIAIFEVTKKAKVAETGGEYIGSNRQYLVILNKHKFLKIFQIKNEQVRYF
jgi:hypothetical protein